MLMSTGIMHIGRLQTGNLKEQMNSTDCTDSGFDLLPDRPVEMLNPISLPLTYTLSKGRVEHWKKPPLRSVRKLEREKTDRRTDGRTDGWTDGRTWKRKTFVWWWAHVFGKSGDHGWGTSTDKWINFVGFGLRFVLVFPAAVVSLAFDLFCCFF